MLHFYLLLVFQVSVRDEFLGRLLFSTLFKIVLNFAVGYKLFLNESLIFNVPFDLLRGKLR